ncbi:MAG: ABC transporter ATP-binding protein, partial [Chloroflexota bacterium]
MTDQYFEEEEFTTQFTGKITLRIVELARPHWKWVIGFILTITLVALLDSYFTFLSAQIIDEGILGENTEALRDIVIR